MNNHAVENRQRIQRLVLDAILISLALVLALAERWIPLQLIVPVPGIKLGLANIVTLFALMRLRPVDALVILVVRSSVVGAISGITTFLFSLVGGLLALAGMWLLSRAASRFVSVIGISLAGAALHNIGQVLVASLLLSEPLLIATYLPLLLLTGLATGLLTGVAALPVIRQIKSPFAVGKAMPQVVLVILASALLILPISGCSSSSNSGSVEKYSYEFTGSFDTVIQFIGYAESEEAFDVLAKLGESRYQELHRLFDAFHNYEGLNNLKTINDMAGVDPVAVPEPLYALIKLSIEWHETYSDKTNIAMGNVSLLWQDYREAAVASLGADTQLPSNEEISALIAHTDLSSVVLDESALTVFVSDPDMRIDLGAVAKGYATELVRQDLVAAGATSLIINAGGSNVCLIGQPLDGRETWQVGLQNPSALLPDDPLADPSVTPAALFTVLNAVDLSVVTSGDYQRFYIVDGVAYHHLLDPATGWPTHYFRAVSVVSADSAAADFLSTALFLMPYEEGRALVESLDGVEALWILSGGKYEMTEGIAPMLADMTMEGK